MYIHTDIDTDMHDYTYIHTHTHIYIYIYIYTCVKNVSESARKCCPVVEFANGSDYTYIYIQYIYM